MLLGGKNVEGAVNIYINIRVYYCSIRWVMRVKVRLGDEYGTEDRRIRAVAYIHLRALTPHTHLLARRERSSRWADSLFSSVSGGRGIRDSPTRGRMAPIQNVSRTEYRFYFIYDVRVS